MIILDRLLIVSIAFVLDKVAQAVEREMNDEDHLRGELLAAHARLETGELSHDALRNLEADLLARIRAIREEKQGGSGGAIEMGPGGGISVDATVEGDEGEVE
jgi:hypothetical protein